jgi:hypothetical protein
MKKTLFFAAILLMMHFHLAAQQGGYALHFDGTNDYVDVTTTNLPASGNITLEVWINVKNFKTGLYEGVIIERSGSSSHGYMLRCGGAGYVEFYVGGSGWAGGSAISSANTILLNQWYHIAGTYDGTSIKLYVDGKIIGTTSYSGGNAGNSTCNLGRSPAFTNRLFEGKIDELRVWNTARTETEIKANMFKEIGTHTNLKAYFKMSNGTGTTLTDNSGNSSTGTLSGSQWSLSGCFAGSRQTLDFDGSNDYVGISNGVVLGNTFTQEMWIYPTDGTEVYRGIVGKQPPTGSVHRPPCIFQYGRKIHFGFGNGTWYSELTGNILTINVWNHLAVTFDATTYRIYVNGILVYSSLVASGQTPEGWGQDELGKVDVGYFQGKIDEVRIWSDERTESEIRENMMRTLAGNEDNLVGYYRFDQLDGSALYDITSGGRNGALTDMDAATDWVASAAFNTWLGGESNTWSTSGNWSSGVPSSTQSVGLYKWTLANLTTYDATLSGSPSINNLYISTDATPTLSSNFTASGMVLLQKSYTLYGGNTINSAGSLLIESGDVITIPADGRLTVSNALTNSAGNSGLVIESGGSLIHNSNSVAATVKRVISGSSTLTANKYHFVSVPTQYTSPTSNLFLGSYLYKLDPEQQEPTNSNYYGKWVGLGISTTTVLSLNQGYMIYYPGELNEYTFAGNLNNGNFVSSVKGNAGTSTFNLVPNPYPSSINWQASSGFTKTNIENKFWIYNNGIYALFTGGETPDSVNGARRFIMPGQAFIIETRSASPSLSMDNGARVHGNAAFLKTGNAYPDRLKIMATCNSGSDEILLKFNPSATPAYDGDFDAIKLSGSAELPCMYTLAENEKLSINTLPTLENQPIVPMNFETQFTGQVTLNFEGLESFDQSLKIYLKDELTNTTINVRNQPVYTFSHNTGNAANRFKLVFGGTIGIEEQGNLPGNLLISGNTLYINTPNLAGQTGLIEVYNASGQKLMSKTIVLSELSTLELNSKGFVVARLTAGNEVMTVKGVLLK